jgi:tRNA(Ile)-lysidine synthetase-like protein
VATRATDAATARVLHAVRMELAQGAPVVVAVSGGRDSMVLLEAVARVSAAGGATVATFDHGTGPAATRAASLVLERAKMLGLSVHRGASERPASTEAGWRAQRLAFLEGVSRELGAHVITAHTLDDHLETVLMRALRGAGARGLAGLFAPSKVGRPFVALARSTVALCAGAWGVTYVDDPTNASRRHLRNRVRLDLLPALARARPALTRELVDLSRRAADLRVALDREIDAHIPTETIGDTLAIAREDLVRFDAPSLALLWPALAARLGVTLDRRGTERLASFTIHGTPGGRIQLSGGAEAIRHRDRILVRGVTGRDDRAPAVLLADGAVWGDWKFVEQPAAGSDTWSAALSATDRLFVRAWQPGDRMVPAGSNEPRRVKGLFRDAGIDAVRRRRWPVVVAGEDVVWIPGVRRAHAAAARSGRPTVTFRCERFDR